MDGDELLLEPAPLPGGPAWAFLTAGSIVRLVEAFLASEETRLHAPAPGGLPGGYPVVIGEGSVRTRSLADLSLGEAIQINQRSHPFDGIHAIEADGTTVFEPETARVMREELGYECETLCPHDSANRASELMSRFREYARHRGVDLERPY